MVILSPCGVSASVTVSSSPGFMNNVLALRDTSGPSGLGEPAGNGMPSVWMKAKFTYSVPTAATQAGLLFCPVLALSSKVSILSAAVHWVALLPLNQPGG